MTEPEFHPDVRIGHVHLRVADLARATDFYHDVLGFDVTAYGPDCGLPGRAKAERHPPRGIRDSTTSPSATLTAVSSAAPCSRSWTADTP